MEVATMGLQDVGSWRDFDIWHSQKLGKAQLDSNQGAFLGLQNKFWSFDLQVRYFNS